MVIFKFSSIIAKESGFTACDMNKDKRVELLKLIEKDARLSPEALGAVLSCSADEVKSELKALEKEGIVCGYRALVNWGRVDRTYIIACIELKVTPKPEQGFDDIARRIAELDEVESVNLMSGGYDLSVRVSGESFQDVALFVAERLAPLESVQATATHFLLRRYKEGHVSFFTESADERGNVSV